MRRSLAGIVGAGAVAVTWGVAEARSLVRRVVELPVPGLPAALDGLSVLHLSDVHAGYGPGLSTLAAATEWAATLRPDLIAVTGDLVARPRGEREFRRLAASLGRTARMGAYAVLGNHDYGEGNDPFATGRALRRLEGLDLLAGERRVVSVAGRRVCLVGVDSPRFLRDRSYDLAEPLDRTADLRILLCHYPRALDRVRPGDYQLILSGHLHAGQICVPWPGRSIGLAHPRAPYLRGVFAREGTIMHVSPGLGTTFVPFRVLAPPEATLLVLRRASPPAPRAR